MTAPATPSPPPRPRLLLVDDEPVLLELMVRLLTDAGYAVVAVGTAEDALAWLEARPAEMVVADAGPMAVVSDVRLPAMNGCRLGREIVRRWPGTRVGFISGYIAEELWQQGICPGSLPLLPKPFRPAAFLAFVRATLEAPPWVPEGGADRERGF